MLDYVKKTPPLTNQFKEIARRMLLTAQNIPTDSSIFVANIDLSNLSEHIDTVQTVPVQNLTKDITQNQIKNLTQNLIQDPNQDSTQVLSQLTVNEYLPGQGIAQHIGK